MISSMDLCKDYEFLITKTIEKYRLKKYTSILNSGVCIDNHHIDKNTVIFLYMIKNSPIKFYIKIFVSNDIWTSIYYLVWPLDNIDFLKCYESSKVLPSGIQKLKKYLYAIVKKVDICQLYNFK